LFLNYFNKMRGGKRSPQRAPLHEIFWSMVGSFLGILLIYLVGHLQGLHLEDSLFLVGSFGASAVLLYAIPASPFAQPRNLILGHIISALAGVSCAILLKDYIAVAAAAAVSISIMLMHLSRSLHPPGGATALIAVVGGDSIHELGYAYVVTPIGIGALILLFIALVVNNISPHRRYPQYWY
jgi:CBS-domain-containing membrane protein